jgi:hypothetical protein
MAPKTRFADSPHVSPPASPDLGSQQSTLDHTPDGLALVLQEMALINARLDSQSADVAAVAAAVANPDTPAAQRRHDANLEPFPDGRDVHTLPLLEHSQLGSNKPDAQTAFVAATAAALVGDPTVAQRRPDAHREH